MDVQVCLSFRLLRLGEIGELEAELPPRRSSVLRNTLRNPAFMLGGLLLIGLAAVALIGERLPNVDPYQIHGVMLVGGEYSAPPFKTSPEFPWGSDHIGRDIRSLVIAGAERTLSLVFFGMLGRMLMGTTLGLLAGWQRNSWLDRLVTSAMGVWAAFPATLFAMIGDPRRWESSRACGYSLWPYRLWDGGKWRRSCART